MTRNKKIPVAKIIRGTTKGASVVADIISMISKKTPKKKKPSPKRVAVDQALSSRATLNRVYPPTSYASSIRNHARVNINRVLFDVCNVPIYTNSAAILMFGTITSNQYAVTLDPNEAIAGGYTIFGHAISSLASNYRRFRITKLKLQYNPMVATTAGGGLAMVCLDDPAILNSGTLFTLSDITSCTDSVISPAWQTADIKPHYNTDWLWTRDPAGTTAASERQTGAGSFAVVSAGSLAASTLYGFLRVQGTIEFADLSPVIGTLAPAAISSSKLTESKEDSEAEVGEIPTLHEEVKSSGNANQVPVLGTDGKWFIPQIFSPKPVTRYP